MIALSVIGITTAVIFVLMHISYKRMERKEYANGYEEAFATFAWFFEAIAIMFGVVLIAVVIIVVLALCTQ
jgi:uncharacterized membrane protein YgaE (UPF0421/DUF939 family)